MPPHSFIYLSLTGSADMNKEIWDHSFGAFIVDIRGCDLSKDLVGFVRAQKKRTGQKIYFLIPHLSHKKIDDYIEKAMELYPEGVVCESPCGPQSIQHMSVKIAVQEAKNNILHGKTKIIALFHTKDAGSNLSLYKDASLRLEAFAYDRDILMCNEGDKKRKFLMSQKKGEEIKNYAQSFFILGSFAASLPLIDAYCCYDAEKCVSLSQETADWGFWGKVTRYPQNVDFINNIFGDSSWT